ncbi:MAG: glycoside hydrolase family 2 [Saprospiraceae bacterium]|nr:glycoside hydrolase family 2 [Saprospiraceae bacterium]
MRIQVLISTFILSYQVSQAQPIPLPEHPRPDFQRHQWQNLNGTWSFAFDSTNVGIEEEWYQQAKSFDLSISVPFPWGSVLSGVDDQADIGWYRRSIIIDADWKGKRTFLTIGASDWETTVWLDGKLLGSHQGGYVPFSFDLTDHITHGEKQSLIIRVDDKRRDFTLYGKQGYGNARGIWQTIYLEARGSHYIRSIHFSPNIETSSVLASVGIEAPVEEDTPFSIEIQGKQYQGEIKGGRKAADLNVPIDQMRLWTLEDPHLYDAKITYTDDVVHTYLGMRSISVVHLPGTKHPYIALNGKPIYLQMALDQSYHPDGFYTFPSDQFMREEIERSKAIGLNGIRPHIKVEIPRKLYWADKLGIMVMADLPNSWGEPDRRMQEEAEYTLRAMIDRDYNHPSIFSWVLFNETWGLQKLEKKNGRLEKTYLPSTQQWVASMYYLAKSLDATRLVEDNSICCGVGHTKTDINSFHDYKPGWVWTEHLQDIVDRSHPGSPFQYEPGFVQGNEPKINSECGNVWGYEGSTGDVDWSYDYHRMLNSFRLFPEIAGWLYTEHHDVINEWNGYWRFDRSNKFTGMGELVEGMSLRDLHSAVYLSTGNEICSTVEANAVVSVPMFLSSMTDAHPVQRMTVSYVLEHTDQTGAKHTIDQGSQPFHYRPYMQSDLKDLVVEMTKLNGLSILKLTVRDEHGQVLQHNFTHFVIQNGTDPDDKMIASVAPNQLHKAQWELKQWEVMDGLKVNGAGTGFFEYRIPVSKEAAGRYSEVTFLCEVSAKQLFVKDTEKGIQANINFMKGGKDAPSRNPNSYPMTDEVTFPSQLTIWVAGKKRKTITLADDPADHRGILSWHHQLKDRKLREAGSYGYLVQLPLSSDDLKNAFRKGYVDIRLESNGGGIAVYGQSFGRYPIHPSLVFN